VEKIEEILHETYERKKRCTWPGIEERSPI
jgi:hypothetical protein